MGIDLAEQLIAKCLQNALDAEANARTTDSVVLRGAFGPKRRIFAGKPRSVGLTFATTASALPRSTRNCSGLPNNRTKDRDRLCPMPSLRASHASGGRKFQVFASSPPPAYAGGSLNRHSRTTFQCFIKKGNAMKNLVIASVLVVGLFTVGAARPTLRDEPVSLCTLEGLKDEKLLSYAPGGANLLVTASADDRIKLWDTKKACKPIAEFRHHQLSGLQHAEVSFTPGHKLIAARYKKGGLVIWDLSKPKLPRQVSLEEHVTPVAFFRDGKLLVKDRVYLMACDFSGTEPQWKHVDGYSQFCLDLEMRLGQHLNFEYRCPAFSQDGKWAAAVVGLKRPAASIHACLLLFRITENGVKMAGGYALSDPLHDRHGFIVGPDATWSMAFVPGEDSLVLLSKSGALRKYRIDKRGGLQREDEYVGLPQFGGAVEARISQDGASVFAIRQVDTGKYQAIRWDMKGNTRGLTDVVESDLAAPKSCWPRADRPSA